MSALRVRCTGGYWRRGNSARSQLLWPVRGAWNWQNGSQPAKHILHYSNYFPTVWRLAWQLNGHCIHKSDGLSTPGNHNTLHLKYWQCSVRRTEGQQLPPVHLGNLGTGNWRPPQVYTQSLDKNREMQIWCKHEQHQYWWPKEACAAHL